MIPLDWMPPLMFTGLILFMLLGFPVAFSLSALGLAFGFVAIEHGFFGPEFLQALPQRFYGILSNDLLLAIPFFTFMGAILEKCGLAEDLLDGLGQLFGPVRGGLGYAVIVVGAILGAITGTVAASVIAMALIAMPVMMRYGYNTRYLTGVIAASGTITQVIPPSLVLVVLADQLGRSVGDMYAGAWGPSLFQVLLFCGYTLFLSVFLPKWVPAVPAEALTLKGWPLIKKCLWGIVPSLVLIFLVLGTLALGLATPTEGGAMGAVGAILLAVLHNENLGPWGQRAALAGLAALAALTVFGLIDLAVPGRPPWLATSASIMFVVLFAAIIALLVRTLMIPELRTLIKQAYEATMRITAMVIFILIGSTCFSLVFQGVDGGVWVEHLLTGLPGGVVGFLVVVNLFVFVLAFFLDFFEIAFIVVPMLAPVAQKMLEPLVGADAALIWFGVMLCVNMQTSFMHPPFGFALFYLRAVAPKAIKTLDIYWGAVPWVGLQLIMVGIVIAWPQVVTALLSTGPTIDPSKVQIEAPAPEPADEEPPQIEVK
jgi:TRAP-type mannitol/chloroaromatic compound transport system permease large subunit